MRSVLGWFDKQLEDTELMMLLAFILLVFVLLGLFGSILAPALVAIALAYVLDGIVSLLVSCKIPRLLGVILVGIGALLTVLFAVLAIMPVLSDQIGLLVSKVPQYVQLLKDTVHDLQAQYPTGLNANYLQQSISSGAEKVKEWGGLLLSKSLASIPNMIALGVYVFLVPVLVFFLLKDKQRIQQWAQQFLPKKRTLLIRVWGELDMQMGNYIRGRFWESSLVGLVMWVVY
ncbi:MAG: AI-2E family transporter, partial [Ghiorsea sp.]|nr:AI-2E family transporter [Ghiorsea sp.]